MQNNQNSDNYYLQNYIISQKDWFTELLTLDIQFAIKYYNNAQILRIYKKIIENKIKLYESSVNNDLENNEKNKRIKFYEKYLNLNINKIIMILKLNRFYTFEPLLNNIKNKINLIIKKNLSENNYLNKTKILMNQIKNLINYNNSQYINIKERFNSIDLRRIGLLEWICNSERSLIELIVHKQILSKQQINIKNRNYNKALENYAANKGKTKNEYMRNRNSIEQIKFNNFNLFTEVKKYHLKSNECKFNTTERNNKNSFIESLSNINSTKIEWNKFIEMIGLEELSFLSKKNRKSFIIINALKKLLNLLLIKIDENDSKILRVSKDIILMGISYILFNDDSKFGSSLATIGKGIYGEIKLLNNGRLAKYENLRASIKEFSSSQSKKIHYPKQSYVSSMNLISFFMQKFLYNLNNNYVPNVYDIKFDFESNKPIKSKEEGFKLNIKSEMIMNYSGRRNSNYKTENLYNLIFSGNYYNDKNFVLFVLKVIKELCVILDFYQKKCMFVHMDLHAKNVMISFKYENEKIDINDFNVKLIDFSFSSIIVNNDDNKLSQFVYINYRPMKEYYITNPYFNADWNQQDLKYFFMALLLYFFNYSYKNSSNKILLNKKNLKYQKINNIINIFIEIFNIDPNYLERLDMLKQNNKFEFCYIGAREVFQVFLKKNAHKSIYGEEFNYNYYIPSELKEKLNEKINSIEIE